VLVQEQQTKQKS